MIVIPQVSFSSALVASGDELPPVRAVRDLARAGAQEVFLLDLDGGVADDPLPQWLEALVAIAGVPVRYDGRLHDARGAERLTRPGFATLVIDHVALFDPMLVRWALDLYGPRLCVELQVDGEYLFDPPQAAFGHEVVDVLGRLHMQGVRRVLYRDVTGDSIPAARLLELGDRVPGMQFTFQGAVRNVDDIAQLASLSRIVEAVVVDGALVVAGEFDLLAANQLAAAAG